MEKKEISSELSSYMKSMGKKGGMVNKKKGSAYFKWVRSKNKRFPVKAKEEKIINQ